MVLNHHPVRIVFCCRKSVTRGCSKNMFLGNSDLLREEKLKHVGEIDFHLILNPSDVLGFISFSTVGVTSWKFDRSFLLCLPYLPIPIRARCISSRP